MRTNHNLLESLESRLCLSGETGLRGDYYSSASEVFNAGNIAVHAAPIATKTDSTVNFSWGTAAPAREIRWSGQVIAPQSGNYTFHVTTGAAVRLWVNGQEIINNWTSQSTSRDNASSTIKLSTGVKYDIQLDINEQTTTAQGVSLQWTLPNATRQVIPQANLYPFSKPINITAGGTYVGSWEDTAPKSVTVTDSTSQPVNIIDSTIRGAGILISNYDTVNISVRNTAAYGLNPNVAGDLKGDFIYLVGPSSVDIEHNTVTGVGGYGIHIFGFNGTGNQTITIKENSILNSDGRYSDGKGGYETNGQASHAILVQNVYNITNMEIGWNQVINVAGQCYVNDVINLYDDSGTAASPIRVDNNYVQGLYSLNVATQYDSGAGITSDGDTHGSKECAFINMFNNQVIGTGSAGIGVPTGHDIHVYDNRTISCGYLSNGTMVYATGTGIYINDLSKIGPGSFYNNGAYHNVSGWVQPPHSKQNGGSTAQRHDYSFVTATASMTYGNTDLSGSITQATESNEFTTWQGRLSVRGIIVGIVPIAI